LDSDTRRQKQQALMAELVERKIRTHARRLYRDRGEVEGHALQDWVQAESEVLGNSILAPLYRKIRVENSPSLQLEESEKSQVAANSDSCQTHA
jgi:Protein of unknown function (DUF2934)